MPANNENNEKHTKLIRTVLLGVLVGLAILGYHLYEYFIHGSGESERELTREHDVRDLTQRLYAEELKHNPYLAKVNFQGKTKPYWREDLAPEPLLDLRELQETQGVNTVALMRRLFDNYELDTLAVEEATAQTQQEELDFLNAVLKTSIMKLTMAFLHIKGVVSDHHKDQLQLLQDIWFLKYSRGQGRVGSSGFEHVFLAELKDQSILGLHNWLYFSDQEALGKLDYKGYIEHVHLGKDNQHLLALRFTFHAIAKPYNTLFVGTSPELELSLYTVCFLLSGGQPCPVQLGQSRFNIITHSWDWRGKKTIATAYPSIEK